MKHMGHVCLGIGEPDRPSRGASLRIAGLGHSYGRRSPPVLRDISFEVAPGEIVALVGRSGCGKSTLLHQLSGLSLPDTGAVSIDGSIVRGPSPRWVMMFQNPSLFPWMTVAQNAGIGLRFAGRGREIPLRVPALLAMVELDGLSERNVQELSGGQQQRVALARSLATEPDLLLLDEPFSALDAFTRANLQQDVRRIARALGLTVVLVTHDLAEAVLVADRALVMAAEPGRIIADTPLDAGPDRRRDTAAFRSEHDRLSRLYERVGGVERGARGPETAAA